MPATPATELLLIEVFSSLQGEGVFIGRRQLFVRLAGCNLDCAYCDTPFAAQPTWTAETAPGAAELSHFPNPASADALTTLIRDWQARFPSHHSLALTGGEPLLQADALADWLPELGEVIPVYLESNGTLSDALARVLPRIDWISMDIKLASTAGSAVPWDAHDAFLAVGGAKVCQVKVVVDSATPASEVVAAARLMARHDPRIPLILQPRTVAGRPAVTGRTLLDLQTAAAGVHADVRVIPQVHPLLALR